MIFSDIAKQPIIHSIFIDFIKKNSDFLIYECLYVYFVHENFFDNHWSSKFVEKGKKSISFDVLYSFVKSVRSDLLEIEINKFNEFECYTHGLSFKISLDIVKKRRRKIQRIINESIQ